MEERFGPLRIGFAISAAESGLSMRSCDWRLGPIRLPAWSAPGIEAREHVDEQGRFRFDVEVRLPYGRRLAGYHGWLVPER